MAAEDAVVLGKPLRDLPTLDTALERYERARRQRVEDNVIASTRMTGRPPTTERRTDLPDGDAQPGLPTLLDWPTPLPE
ncbi:MAG: hypothetical protein GEV07_03720 [Streptosporangiales bacterium]|nr:hypothetical protein [Streptosporangiales bacterium]